MINKKSEEKPSEEKQDKSEKEIESLVIDLAKQGLTSEKIGLKLKKEHNINAKLSGLKISKILRKHNLYQDADIKNLTEGVDKLKKHIAKNRQDHNTKRALFIKEAKLKKLRELK